MVIDYYNKCKSAILLWKKITEIGTFDLLIDCALIVISVDIYVNAHFCSITILIWFIQTGDFVLESGEQ